MGLMRFTGSFTKAVALMIASTLLICTSIQPARAAMVATERVLQASSAATQAGARERLRAFFDRADVRGVLEGWGVTAAEAQERVAALTDAEAASIAGKLDKMPAGANGVVGPIVGAILLIFLILLITDLLGLTDVFPFIRKRR